MTAFETKADFLARMMKVVGGMGSGDPLFTKIWMSVENGDGYRISGGHAEDEMHATVHFDGTLDGVSEGGIVATHEVQKVVTLLTLFDGAEKLDITVDDYIHFLGAKTNRSGRVGLTPAETVVRPKREEWVSHLPGGYRAVIDPKNRPADTTSWERWAEEGNTIVTLPASEISELLDIGSKSEAMEKKPPIYHFAFSPDGSNVVVGDERDKSSSLVTNDIKTTKVLGPHVSVYLHHKYVAPTWGTIRFGQEPKDCFIIVPKTADNVSFGATLLPDFRATFSTSVYARVRK